MKFTRGSDFGYPASAEEADDTWQSWLHVLRQPLECQPNGSRECGGVEHQAMGRERESPIWRRSNSHRDRRARDEKPQPEKEHTATLAQATEIKSTAAGYNSQRHLLDGILRRSHFLGPAQTGEANPSVAWEVGLGYSDLPGSRAAKTLPSSAARDRRKTGFPPGRIDSKGAPVKAGESARWERFVITTRRETRATSL